MPALSVMARLPIYEATVVEIRQRPWLGHGLFTFRFLEEAMLPYLHPHNILLFITHSLGLAGLALSVWQATRVGWRVWREDASDRMGWNAALLATSLHQLVDVTWMSPGMMVMLPVLLAGATAFPASPPVRHPTRTTWSVAILALGVLGCGWYFGYVDPKFFQMSRSAN